MPRRRFTSGAVVLHHHVGTRDKPFEQSEPARSLQIESNGAFVALQVLKVRPVSAAAEDRSGVGVLGRLDLDYVGPPVGELAHGGGSGPDAGQIEHREARQGAFAARHRDLRAAIRGLRKGEVRHFARIRTASAPSVRSHRELPTRPRSPSDVSSPGMRTGSGDKNRTACGGAPCAGRSGVRRSGWWP